MPFTLGQRWISDTESELGLGTVVAMDARTVTLLFPSTGENRLYARSDSPVTRVMFNPGDTITSHEGWQLHIDEVKEENGLLAYVGTRLDTEETNVTLREVLLDSKLVFSKPRIVCSPVKSIEWIGSRCAIAPGNFRASSTVCRTAACAASEPI
ncbi:ATP-dependent helicase HepA [Salmonella enterica subsp. arizonae]|uniref:ATP-dependent helicase HepA n=1 Tax=Salmonella enterica subsp. arizonae TaxID=59203 RepID=A0A2X4WTL4_SALER|nr:ATP-dependent helicase HepA [Salmonella enterica subsp. arizonae]